VNASPEVYSSPAWSPYLVGALIGVLSMFTFYFSNKPIGVSSAYAKLAGLVGNLFSKRHTMSLKYFQDNPPTIDWEMMLLFGVILGRFGLVLFHWRCNERMGSQDVGGKVRDRNSIETPGLLCGRSRDGFWGSHGGGLYKWTWD
jgi:hypothetical protein